MNIALLETRVGKLYVPDTDTQHYAWLSVTGESPEYPYIKEVCALLDERPRGTAIDAGANFGTWTLALAAHAIRVIAYEAHPDICELLYRSVCENGLGKKISVRNFALWSQSLILELPFIDMGKESRFSDFGGIRVGMPGTDRNMLTTLGVTLDEDVQHEHVSFIKIDVEGSEHEVLLGARDLIKKNKPIMFIEVVHPNTDTEALIQQITDLGYIVTRRDVQKFRKQWGNALAMPI